MIINRNIRTYKNKFMLNMDYRFQFLLLPLCVVLLLNVGCGGDSNIGQVEGVVSLDGEPLKRAMVCFHPADARGSAGFTDDEGHYELRYLRNIKGAVVGEHKVTISTKIAREDDDASSEFGGKGRAETMPPKYLDRNKTELSATVVSGRNTVDFDLTSE